ncbi:phage tail tip lysozyme [Mesorhizobium sp. YM1C-6-2]|uniref:phage tail tip lysozyme n=1 Tax=Mesorhizobium sp. YM1C-6-2 TaxID=1827501 RepID=UPI001AECE90F|nr:phage tail tip lysozyme [Mesorhizobium sp. YM1C-6-2]
MAQAEPILDGIYRKFGMMGDASVFAARGQDELAAAISRANARLIEQNFLVRNRPSGRVPIVSREQEFVGPWGRPSNHPAAANQNTVGGFNSTNAAFQIQDIAMMSMMGQAPLAVGLQQGPQLAMAMLQGGGVSALGAGLMSLVNPTMLLTVGLTAATAAAIQFFTSSEEGSEDVQKSLDDYIRSVDALDAAYGRVGNSAEQLGRRSTISLAAAESRSRKLLEITQKGEIDRVREGLDQRLLGNRGIWGAILPGDFDNVVPTPFRDAMKDLRQGIVDGDPDFARFQTRISEIAATDPGRLNEWRDRLFEMTDQAAQLEQALEGIRDGIIGSQDPINIADRRALTLLQAQEAVAAQRRQQAFDAETQQMLARSPAELAAAARAREAATYNGDESAQARRDRIELAGKRALIEAEHDLAEAQRERNRSLDATLASAQLDLELIGKSTAETERLRLEHQLLQQLREDAARNNVAVDEAEIARIREKSAEYGRLRAIEEARTTIRGQQDRIETARAEIATLGMSEDARARVIEQLKVEQEIRRLGIDLYGAEANAMRANAAALADLAAQNAQLERTRDTWQSIFDQAGDGIDSLVDSLFEGGQDIGEVLKQVGRDFARLAFDLAVTNPLKNWLTGSDLNSIADLGIFGSGASSGRGGGFGGVLGNLLGAQRAVASMQVQAASVFINGAPVGVGRLLGGFGGSPAQFGSAGGLASMLGIVPANGNGVPMSLAGIGSPGNLGLLANDFAPGFLGGIGSPGAPGMGAASSVSGGGIAGQVWNFFAGKGLAPHQIAGIMGNVSAESAFNPLAVGDGGNAFGLFQWNDRSGSLFNHIGGRGNLGSVSSQLDFAWKELQTTESRAMQALLGSKDVRGATSAFAGFERPRGFSWGNPEGAHNFSGRLQGAEEALEKFGNVSTEVTGSVSEAMNMVSVSGIQVSQSLVNAAGGLNNFGSMLSSFLSSPMGGGSSWFQGLMGSFGGAGGALGFMNSISPKATAHILGGFGGLFTDGGFTGFGGKYEPAGLVHRGEFVFDAASTSRIGVSTLEAMRRMPGFAEGGYVAANRNTAHANSNGSDRFKIINVFDPTVVGDYLATAQGEKVLINAMRRNGK